MISVTRTLETTPEVLGKGDFFAGRFELIEELGADWGLIRADNCFELDVRIVIETDDGAFIHAEYSGIAPMTKEQVDRFLAGELPKGVCIYITPRFETGHENYQWLTQIQAVGRGSAEIVGDKIKITYSLYELRV